MDREDRKYFIVILIFAIVLLAGVCQLINDTVGYLSYKSAARNSSKVVVNGEDVISFAKCEIGPTIISIENTYSGGRNSSPRAIITLSNNEVMTLSHHVPQTYVGHPTYKVVWEYQGQQKIFGPFLSCESNPSN
jgi:hypothetical protein